MPEAHAQHPADSPASKDPGTSPGAFRTHLARGTVLGFDFGLARTGVATGELETGHASPLTTIHADSASRRFEVISRLITEWQPVALVVGMPTHPDGGTHEMAPRCRRFANQLRGRYRLPVFECDERLSSAAADVALHEAGHRHWRDRKVLLDAVAAQLILQHFLDAPNHEPT